MSDKPVKILKTIKLPVTTNDKAEFCLEDGNWAASRPIEIESVVYNKGYIFVTFQTKNTIYKNAPIRVTSDYSEINDGWIMEKGSNFFNEFGRPFTIAKILRVTDKGVTVMDDKGVLLLAKIELAPYQIGG